MHDDNSSIPDTPEFDPELVQRVIGHVKENLDPLDALDGLTEDELTIIKATWAIGSNLHHVGQWSEAVQYVIPVKGHRTDAEYLVEHDLLKYLKVGLTKLINN